jgi:VCBS repeat-containing protein
MGIVVGQDLTFDGQTPSTFMPVTSTLALPTGGFVVTWIDGDYDLHVQKFSDDGTLLGSREIVMDTVLYDGFFAPTMAVLSTGEIAITWTSLSATAAETDVLLQVFDSSLVPQLSVPAPVSVYGADSQGFSQIAAIDTGGFAISWFGDTATGTSGTYDVSVRAFTTGAAVADIDVNTLNTAGDQYFSNVMGLSAGFVVSWFDDDTSDVYIAIYDDNGSATTAPELLVNDDPANDIGIIGMARLSSGNFVTAWSGETTGDANGGIALKIFEEDGDEVTSGVVEANTSTSGVQMLSSVTALNGPGGGFVVAWGACGCSGSGSALAVFNNNGTVRRAEVSLDANSDTIPTVKVLADGSFVAAWAFGDTINNDLGFAVRVFNEDGSLRYSEDVDLDDSVDIFSGAQLEIAALDNGGFVLSSALYTGTYSQVFDITRDGPTSSSSTVTLLESSSYTFSLSNFPFGDAEQDSLTGIQITSLPTNGTLKLSGVAVTAGQTILPADIGNLVWTPAIGASGNGLGSLSYKLIDDGVVAAGDSNTSDAYSITFNVTRINDAPTAANLTRTTPEDVAYVFSAASFGFTDGDGDVLKTITISSIPAAGTLSLNGQVVTAGQSITAEDIAAGKLVWTPPTDVNGSNLAALTFKVQDTGGVANGGVDTSGTYTLKFDVTAVNDAPVLDYHGATTTLENAKLKMDVLSGASDIDGGTLSVKSAEIVTGFGKLTVNKDGTLTYDPTKAPNQDIAEGESKTVTISYTVSDGKGGETTDEIDITVEGVSPDIFRGTAKRDTLIGTSGDDRILGLANKDNLDGRGGDDILKGGKHADIFVFGADYGRDTIVDFKPEDGDRIDLSDAVGITNFNDLMRNHIEDVGKNLVITADDGSMLVLRRVDLDDLDRDSFLF